MKKIGSLSLVAVAFVAVALVASTFAYGSAIVFSGLVQVGDTLVPYEVTTDRYIVVADTLDIGTTVPLDQDLVESLCQDIDGCAVVFQSVDRFASEPGNVASQTAHLFLSEDDATEQWWHLSVGVKGEDGNSSTSQWQPTELDGQCRFSDAEANGITGDSGIGFGLLNIDDTFDSNTCRLLFID